MKKIEYLTEEDVCKQLMDSGKFETYLNMNDYHRQMFMDFCTGKSMKMLTYDSIFKYIFQPRGQFGRLENFLTAVLGFSVHIERIMPLESEKIIESGSILNLDVLAKTTDGSIINVEMQKYPYEFCGEREACYQSDMIMRQYNALKNEAKIQNKKFSYRDLRPVYTIILLEKSYYEFLRYKDKWIHRGRMMFDTGIELSYPLNVTYIAIDNFIEIGENIDNNLEKWVYLFAANTPEKVMKAAGMSDEFFEIICDVSKFCRNISGVMDMFSDALRMLDRNTEEYMHEQMLEELKQQRAELEQNKAELEQNKAELKLSKKILLGFMQGKSKEELALEHNLSVEELEMMVKN